MKNVFSFEDFLNENQSSDKMDLLAIIYELLDLSGEKLELDMFSHYIKDYATDFEEFEIDPNSDYGKAIQIVYDEIKDMSNEQVKRNRYWIAYDMIYNNLDNWHKSGKTFRDFFTQLLHQKRGSIKGSEFGF